MNTKNEIEKLVSKIEPEGNDTAKGSLPTGILGLVAKYREENDSWPNWYCDEEFMRVCIERTLGKSAYLHSEGGYECGGRVQVFNSGVEYRLVIFVRRSEDGGWDASERVLLPSD